MFINKEHEERYKKLKNKCKCNHLEFNSLMYIVSGVEQLYNKAESIYNFKENKLNLSLNDEGEPKLSDLYLSSSATALLNLGIQMYNGGNSQNVFDTFCFLDEDNSLLAINCIKMRFNIK